jgi:hypothetical protein
LEQELQNPYLYEDLVIQSLQDAGIFTEFTQDGKNFLEAMRAQKLPALAAAIKIQHQLPPLSKWQAVAI